MNILLICGGGFSSSFLVQNMKKAAQKLNLDANIDARSEAELASRVANLDIVLVTPQLRYNEKRIKEVCDKAKVPYEHIPQKDFGAMNGEAIIQLALKKIESYKAAQG